MLSPDAFVGIRLTFADWPSWEKGFEAEHATVICVSR
jgi:hypothetical protein